MKVLAFKGLKFLTIHGFILFYFEINLLFPLQLQLDGKTQTVHSSRAHLHAPERHLQPKFVIGARWVGSAVKYADFFNGLISGLVITTDSASNALDQNGEVNVLFFFTFHHFYLVFLSFLYITGYF